MFLPGFSFHPQRSLLLLQAPHVLKIRSGHRMFIYYWFRTNYIQITLDGKHCLPASRYTCSKSSGHSLKYPSSDPMTQKVSFTLMQFIASPVPGTTKRKVNLQLHGTFICKCYTIFMLVQIQDTLDLTFLFVFPCLIFIGQKSADMFYCDFLKVYFKHMTCLTTCITGRQDIKNTICSV